MQLMRQVCEVQLIHTTLQGLDFLESSGVKVLFWILLELTAQMSTDPWCVTNFAFLDNVNHQQLSESTRLTPRSAVILEKLLVAQLVKNFHAHGAKKVHCVFTSSISPRLWVTFR
jgi:hypothetical protein